MRGLLAFGVLLSASAVGLAGESGVLEGTVRDGAGAVLGGAAVLVQGWHSSAGAQKTPVAETKAAIYTDSEGKFTVNLSPGLYDVFVSYVASTPFAKRVRITAKKRMVLDFDLPFDSLTKWVE